MCLSINGKLFQSSSFISDLSVTLSPLFILLINIFMNIVWSAVLLGNHDIFFLFQYILLWLLLLNQNTTIVYSFSPLSYPQQHPFLILHPQSCCSWERKTMDLFPFDTGTDKTTRLLWTKWKTSTFLQIFTIHQFHCHSHHEESSLRCWESSS